MLGSYAGKRYEAASGGQEVGDRTGGAESGGDENRLPAVRETKAADMEKDGPMPIHGELFPASPSSRRYPRQQIKKHKAKTLCFIVEHMGFEPTTS